MVENCAEYEEEWQQLRDRWKGNEEELKALIAIIKANANWHETKEYKILMEGLGPLPEGVEEVERDLRGAPLCGVDLSDADLSGADLSGADLSGADLSEADLSGADLTGVDLSWADLSGAKLIQTDLSEAYLPETDLSGAELFLANLSNTYSWFGIRWNSKNRLWPRIRRFDFWCKKLKPSERKTLFGINDIRNVNWSGAAMLKRYVEDENFLEEYERHPGWGHKTVSWL
ncbi:MAG: pentapeptide repeat-containing protein, partial [Candidatus Latescibacteria bacterium]|nr:pentapeptide repeat-containing protein [Candidatus Latescibacterota bacterium]